MEQGVEPRLQKMRALIILGRQVILRRKEIYEVHRLYALVSAFLPQACFSADVDAYVLAPKWLPCNIRKSTGHSRTFLSTHC